MKDKFQIISLGCILGLALVFALLATSLVRLQSRTDELLRRIDVSGRKTAAAGEMHEAIRLRTEILKTMRKTPDIFEREAAYRRFVDHAADYRLASDRLSGLSMDPEESAIHDRLRGLVRKAQSYTDTAAGMLMGGSGAEQTTTAIDAALRQQGQLLGLLDRLVGLENRKSRAALAARDGHDRDIRRLLAALSVTALCMVLSIVQLVMRRGADRARLPGRQATRDPLTGLINRREFEARVERAISHAQAHSATHALLYLDIEQFKSLNDACGQSAGDELLRQISQLLMSSVRNRDTLGRFGGDEFGMLLENCPLDKAVNIAEDLLRAMDSFRFTRGDKTFAPGISIGVVPLDRSTSCLASAMSAADSACYIARGSGRNRLQIAQLGDLRLQERHGQMQWVTRLNRALEENRFALFFQPIVPCAGPENQDKHIEILLRMIDDDGSVVAPGVFLPAAEEYGLVTSLDRWVIEHSLAWLASRSGPNHWPVMITINLSGQSISDPAFQKFILECVKQHDILPRQVCFEITETAAIANITAVTGFMLTMRGYGFRFALDDFGSSLSSFIYLKKLPVDFLKIDGMFVRDIMSDPVDHAVVRAISELGQLLGKQTIAEYVETVAVANELKRMGINHFQGFVYAQPQSLEDFEQIMGPRLFVVSSR